MLPLSLFLSFNSFIVGTCCNQWPLLFELTHCDAILSNGLNKMNLAYFVSRQSVCTLSFLILSPLFHSLCLSNTRSYTNTPAHPIKHTHTHAHISIQKSHLSIFPNSCDNSERSGHFERAWKKDLKPLSNSDQIHFIGWKNIWTWMNGWAKSLRFMVFRCWLNATVTFKPMFDVMCLINQTYELSSGELFIPVEIWECLVGKQ